MSVTIGLIGDSYSLIAADTRITHLSDNGYSDNSEKLIFTDFGWIANGGGVQFSTRVLKKFLDTHRIKTRRHIYIAWLSSIRDTELFAEKCGDPELCKNSKAELFSSHAIYSINFFKDGKPHIEVETVDFVYQRRKLQVINSLVVFPPKRTIRTKRLIAKYSDIARSITNIHEAIYVMACFLDDLSKISRWVSNTLDCGISLQIDNEILFLRLKENTKAIKKLYKAKQDLSEIMMVCGNKVEGE